MITHDEYINAVEVIRKYRIQLLADLALSNDIGFHSAEQKWDQCEISVRCWNAMSWVLKSHNKESNNVTLKDVHDIVAIDPNAVRHSRNFGKKSAKELNKVFLSAGLSPLLDEN